MPKNLVKEKALPVGLFILLAVVLLTSGIIYIRNLQNRPAYSFVAAFSDPDRVSPGVVVYYRGVQVGKVTDVGLDKDYSSTLVTIGISDENLRLSEATKIYVRMEGITGQRFMELDPPVAEKGPVAYIDPGEIVRGEDNVTWDQLQKQLAHIAEERTLEKLLTSTQYAMENMAVMSTSLRGFFDDTRQPAQQAVNQFNHTARSIELAADDFRGVVGPVKDSLPQITTTFERLGESTEGVDEALASVRSAADEFGGVANTFNQQLLETNLIPETAGTVRSIRSGVESVQGTSDKIGQTVDRVNVEVLPSVRGASEDIRKGVSGVRTGLSGKPTNSAQVQSLAVAGKKLDSRVRAISPDIARSPRTRQDLQRLAVLTTAIDAETQALERAMDKPATAANLQDVRTRLAQLELMSDETSKIATRVQPVLKKELAGEIREYQQRSARGEKIPPKLVAANHMIVALDELGETSQQLSATVTQVQPVIAQIKPSKGKTSGGIFGGIGATLQQLRHTAARFDCLAAQTSDLMGKSFLGFRLFFGAPGSSIDCDHAADLSEHSLYEGKAD